MNHISVKGGTKRERSLVYKAAIFSISKLMPRMKTLDVDIRIKSIEGEVDGYCMSIDNRTFEIEIQAGISKDDMITAVFHEFTHVKQHARKELIDRGIIKQWMGTDWIMIFSTVDEYMALPWEEEAYRLQEVLFEEWNYEAQV